MVMLPVLVADTRLTLDDQNGIRRRRSGGPHTRAEPVIDPGKFRLPAQHVH
jgi:hypothetical protein